MPNPTNPVAAIRYDSIYNAITAEYQRMHHGAMLDGWTASAVTDAVCYRLQDIGVNILDIPTHCMEGDPRLLPPGHPAGYRYGLKP